MRNRPVPRFGLLLALVVAGCASPTPTASERVRTDAPTGGGVNFWDDVIFVRLDALPVPMQVGVSTRYWEFADPDDPRLAIEPDVSIPASAENYFAGIDPALEAAIRD